MYLVIHYVYCLVFLEFGINVGMSFTLFSNVSFPNAEIDFVSNGFSLF
jgi:hypothetical protein